MDKPKMFIMKITDDNSHSTGSYFKDLFVNDNSIKQIGYTKDSGDKIATFKKRWENIEIGDLIVVLQGMNKVHGVVEVASEPWDEEGEGDSDWFFHRREANLIKFFESPFTTKSSTNRDTIIEYSGDGAKAICDEIWNLIKNDYFDIEKSKGMEKYINLLKSNKNLILTGAPGTGKSYLANEIANIVTTEKAIFTPIQLLEQAIGNFKPDVENDKDLQQKRDAFLSKFPIDKLSELTLDSYCAGKGDRDNFCWWIETGLKQLGSFAPAQRGAFVYGIFFNAVNNEYKKRDTLIEQGDEDALNNIIQLINSVLSAVGDDTAFHKAIESIMSKNYFDNGFLMKILTTYFPNKFIPIHSLRHLQKCVELFRLDIKSSDKNNIFKLNQALFNYYETLKAKTNIKPYDFMRLLYSNFNIKDGEIIYNNQEIILKGEVGFVQFHPSYDYTDFVEGLRPIKKEGEKELGFELKNGIFKEFCKKAKDNPNKKYVFIIDEINRAEVSKIFGELFYALDPGYRGVKGAVSTQYHNIQEGDTIFDDETGKFYVPENVYIIGTMNDIDRSVESFDFAMRRRFAWKEVKADDRISMWDGTIDKWKAEAKSKMGVINKIIENTEGLNSSYHIGPAYFLKLAHYDGNFQQLWDYHIGVILNEYLRGMPNAHEDFKNIKEAYDDAK